MSKAARAIIIENGQILLMHREKENNQYYTLVGGQVKDNETTEQALFRKVMDETGLSVTSYRLVFIEEHPAPYAEQYIYLCEAAPHNDTTLKSNTEESYLNSFSFGSNIHQPLWASIASFPSLPFRTPQLRQGIIDSIKHGFPKEPQKL